MEKASRALSSARLLLGDGDAEGDCNRAYYAMFDAAHAALLFACWHELEFEGLETLHIVNYALGL